ncbi:MAG TPA: oxygen-independent coproporphyrinogen III oxidase [Sphingobacteriaceae bacterium]|nr:oxygen-independent coproporphyrinogen III oxidase [Sphingobacteriaceae bacterium]
MNQEEKRLIKKYNVAAPRYTSYPTVPLWNTENWNENEWVKNVVTTHNKNKEEGISLYIHLPFCESLCTYCGCNTRITKNHSVELPYINDVIKEWNLYRQHLGDDIIINEIHLGGGTPTFFQPENLELLVTSILRNTKTTANAEFSFEAHPANTTKEHLETLYKLGFKRLSLGIQDFDPLVQFVINRTQTVDEVNRVMMEAREIGYTSINFDLIYGLPKQSLKTVQNTIEEVIRLKPDRISFYSYAHVPWLKPGQRRYTDDDLPQNHEKLQLYELGKTMICDAGFYDVGMDHFALPDDSLFLALKEGTLHRNFMGYTDRSSKLLIGLGVSSISDSWSAFAQNVKKVEEYREILKQDKLPLMKGHIHTPIDEILRKNILEIMCQGKTTWNETKYDFFLTVHKNLVKFESDGLIRLTPNSLEITEQGKAFIRNICMVFDARLTERRPTENTFSQAI